MPSTSSRPALWALADCNNFFASCEQLFRPDLVGKPVVVLSSNDGCIVSRSAEAKALGIKMGTPEFQARSLLKKYGVAVFSSNFSLYADISARVMASMAQFCPELVQYSIDEAFLPLQSGKGDEAAQFAWRLRETVYRWTGISISVGVAPTRTLAKAANHVAKKGTGVMVWPDTAALPALLRQIPVSEVWGIGRRQAEKLALLGVNTARDFAAMDEAWIKKRFTIAGLRTAQELRGIEALREENAPVSRRTLVVSRSFAEKITQLDPLAQAVATFTAKAAVRLRKDGLLASGIAVHIRTARHGAGPLYDVTGQSKLQQATCDTGLLQAAARSVLCALYREGLAFAKAGVMLYGLCPERQRQAALFPAVAPAEQARREALMRALDGVNKKFGSQTLRFGAEGTGPPQWGIRRRNMSPRATTSWHELAIARCG